MKTLEALYYGTINLPDYAVSNKKQYQNLIELMVRHETDLMATLTQTQQETFQKFNDCMDEIHDMTALKAFTNGFTLASKIMVEVMAAEKEEV